VDARTPGEGRYAQVEREQRWLVSEVPAEAAHPAAIIDLYISGTTLRLRRIEVGGDVVLKLGQKVRVQPLSPEVVKLTNIYISQGEYDVLAQLGGAELRKTRWRMIVNERTVAIDRFEGRVQGLVLAEVELLRDEPRWAPPPFAVADVTDDDRFSGGRLAHAGAEDVARLLAEAAALTRSRPG
jgi:CYTH domain-containing protein